jgi:hypothetical protein
MDPRLEALADNGATTQTMAPVPGSPVIDRGNSGGVTTDQRGKPRPFSSGVTPPLGGDSSDIGAVEVQSGEFEPLVTNTGDSGLGSLRRALSVANLWDIILFSPAVTNVIKLTSGELGTDKNITISGPGAKFLTISGNNSNRVFNITGGNVTLSGLTIANGNADGGGGIRVGAGTLNIYQCQIMSNTAPDLIGGGGIYVLTNASLVLSNSAIAFNHAYILGGGIYVNGGQAAMWNCTVFSNALKDVPNGIFSPFGAGIVVYQGSLGIISSTVSSNSSTHTAGGIAIANGAVNIRSSIVAGNIATNAAPDVFGAITSGGYNLIGNTNGGSGFGASGDQLNVNPLLAAFADYGGPTLTMALRGGSPAIDRGKNFDTTTDQRGAPRPFDFASFANAIGGDGSDIGAFELGSPQLNIRPAPGNNVVLSWPSYYGDFTLESVTNLAASNIWNAVPSAPVIEGDQFNVTNAATDVRKFYRLKGL